MVDMEEAEEEGVDGHLVHGEDDDDDDDDADDDDDDGEMVMKIVMMMITWRKQRKRVSMAISYTEKKAEAIRLMVTNKLLFNNVNSFLCLFSIQILY